MGCFFWRKTASGVRGRIESLQEGQTIGGASGRTEILYDGVMKALKKPHTKYSALTAGVAVLLCFVTFSVSTYAWLVNYVFSGNFGYQAGELDSYKLEIARIPYKENEADRVETARTYSPCENYHIETNEDGTALAVEIKNMSFGTIDNVAQLKPENIVYLRLTVPKECGKKISVSLYYSLGNFIRLYRKIEESGSVSTPEVTDSGEDTPIQDIIKVEETAGSSYLLYDAVVSDTAYEANEIAAYEKTAIEEEKEGLPFAGAENDFNCFLPKTETGEVSSETLTYSGTGSEYYVYIKVIPNLSVFAYSIEHLTAYMPCFMYFSIGASFDTSVAYQSESASESSSESVAP